MMKKFLTLKFGILAVILTILGGGIFFMQSNGDNNVAPNASQNNYFPKNIPSNLSDNFDTDFSKSNLEDFSSVVQGLPASNPKNVIPALTNPKFVSLSEADLADDVKGMFLEINSQQKFYPYTVLVWHEIVNDKIGGKAVAVTFCPLCGTAIAYIPIVDGEKLEFAVSGFLRESNMIMFDRKTESLWQQSTGLSFAGAYNDVQLERLPIQLLTVKDIRDIDENMMTLSSDTGHFRNYGSNPYGDYDENNDDFVFKPSTVDKRFDAKELFYIIPAENKSVALRVSALEGVHEFSLESGFKITVSDIDGLLVAKDSNGKVIPGYYEMWFSWAVWHQTDGVIWEPT